MPHDRSGAGAAAGDCQCGGGRLVLAGSGSAWLSRDDDRSAMSSDEPAGVVFPVSADGRRSTSAVGRAVVADALRRADPAAALDAEQDTNWRTGYMVHFRRLVEAGMTSRDAAVSVARDGLESLHRRMRIVHPGGAETGLGTALSAPAQRSLETATVPGAGGAGAEVGPVPVLLGWGARVIAVDLPRPAIWERLLDTARRSGGTLLVPVAREKPGQHQPAGSDEVRSEEHTSELQSQF